MKRWGVMSKSISKNIEVDDKGELKLKDKKEITGNDHGNLF